MLTPKNYFVSLNDTNQLYYIIVKSVTGCCVGRDNA